MVKTINCLDLFLCVFYLLINLIAICKSNVKIWNSNIELNNPLNWNLKRIACDSDRIFLPENFAIYLNFKLKAREIILPKNGQIILGEKASISLIDKKNYKESTCEGKDIKLSPQQDNDWFDPYNWNQTIDIITSDQLISEFNFSGRIENGNPIPHMERIPCLYDSVFFSTNTTFKVNIELNTDISVKSLNIWDKSFDTESFKQLTESNIGKQLFSLKDYNNNFLIDQSLGCNVSKGCLCGNENPLILSKICKRVFLTGCSPVECSDPIRPVGHCCEICASMLTIAFKNDYSLDLIRGITTAFQIKEEYSSVRSYLHKLNDQRFQLIAVDLGEKGLADRMANAIKQYFNDDTYLGPGIYAIDSIQINSSTDWNSSSAGVWILVIILITIAIGVGLGLTYYYQQKRIKMPFAFARFHGFDSEDGVELEMGTTPHEALDPNIPIQSSSTKPKAKNESINFENPIFAKHEINDKDSRVEQKSSELTSVENPFFST